jgi:hypothetical protein
MIECALKIREVSLRGIPKQDINIMRKVLEKISQNLRMEFDVGCTVVDSIANSTTTTAATTTTARKKKS